MNLTRRRFLQSSTALALPAAGYAMTGMTASGLALAQAPAVVTSERSRPQLPYGVQSGDIAPGRGLVWSRSDRPARMWVEWSTTSSFTNVQRVRGPYALEDSDFTARLDLTGLPAGQDIFYRVSFEDLAGGGLSAPVAGHFRSAPQARRDIRFVWSGDTCGQGWGINEAAGGMKCYETMRAQNPDFFLHSGDTIYADGAIKAEVQLPDGTMWKNLVTEEKSKVAETLNEFRGAYRYNMMDANVRRFNSEVAQIWQWDDHEVTNNYSDSKDLSKNNNYKEKNVALLAARGRRAYLEYAPMRPHTADEPERVYRKISYGPLLDVFVIDMRSYRGPNTTNLQTEINNESVYLGAAQIAWLTKSLKESKATWKVIASDMPIGLQVDDGKDANGKTLFEAVANGDNGVPAGRELEIAQVLKFIKHNRIRNTVWLTADVHYTAAHYYSPTRAKFTDFDPFWEFVSGPLHAGTFGPNPTDDTFGIEVKYQKAPAPGQVNLPPSANLQFFGEVLIDAKTAAMKVMLKDWNNVTLWSTELAPRLA
jgi:alkaline phosphatase D